MDNDFKVYDFPLDDNLNNKFGSDYFVHIHKEAKTKIGVQHLGIMVVKFTGDSSGQLYVLSDYECLPMKSVPAHLVGCSHGMHKTEFYRYMNDKFGMYPDDNVGLYFFQKLKKVKE